MIEGNFPKEFDTLWLRLIWEAQADREDLLNLQIALSLVIARATQASKLVSLKTL